MSAVARLGRMAAAVRRRRRAIAGARCRRSRRPAPAAAARARRSAPAACRRSTPGSTCRPASRSGCPADIPAPLLQLEWCAPFTRPRPRRAARDSSTAASGGSPTRSARAIARRWARVGVGGDLSSHVPGPRRPRPRARLRPGRADRAGRGARTSACPTSTPSSARGRRSPSSTSTARPRATNVAGAFAPRPSAAQTGVRRPLGRARRRRHDDRRDAGGLRARAPRGAARSAVSAVTVARER